MIQPFSPVHGTLFIKIIKLIIAPPVHQIAHKRENAGRHKLQAKGKSFTEWP
jgi:hypothetical protein